MKLYKYIALASVALFAAACTEDALDDLSGKYPAPAATTYTAATDNGVTKDGSKRIFDVTFTGTAGETLNMKFVGDAYFLHAAAFTPADVLISRNQRPRSFLTFFSSAMMNVPFHYFVSE